MIAVPRSPMGRPRLHALGTTWHDRRTLRDAAMAIADQERAVAALLGQLASALDDFARSPGTPSQVVEARGDAIAGLQALAEALSKTAGRLSGVAEVRWMAQRLVWPQAAVCRRDAEELRAMAEKLTRIPCRS